MKLSRTQLAVLCLIFANVIWGASAPIFKWAMEDIHPFTFVFLRFFLSALVILPFTMHKLKIKPADISLLVFLAVVGVALRLAYNMYGLTLTPSINSPIISSATPIFILIGSVFLLHEKMRKKVLNGAFLGLVGVMLIVLEPVIENGFDTSWIGNIFFIVSMVLGVIYTLLLKELAPRYNALTLLFWLFVIASITLFPFSYIEIERVGLWNMMHMQGLIGILFAVLFCTCLAYLLHIYGLKYIKASEVGLFSYVDPFVAIAIANPLLGEQVTTTFFFGAFLVFVGIFMAEGRIHYHPLHLLKRKPDVVEIESRRDL